jgi:hypothetical protein
MKKSDLKTISSLWSVTILILFVFAFPHCKNDTKAYISKVGGNDVVICPIDKVSDTIHLPLSSLVESCEMVKLQTTDSALFDYARHTLITDKYICIKSYGKFPVKLFTRKGQFIRNIGAIGRGPGEYSSLGGMQFNQEGTHLYLLPEANARKILVYDIEGNHIRDIPLVYPQRKFKGFLSPDSIITILSMPLNNDSAVCFQQSFDGKLIQKVSPPSYLISKNYDGEIFTNYSPNSFEFYNTVSDTLYHYNTAKNILEPKFALSFGEGKKGHGIYSEIPGFYFCFNILVDKKTLDAKYFDIKNDFLGGINVLPQFARGYFINDVTAIYLKQQLDKAITNKNLTDQIRQKLTDLNNSLSPDDNNVIFFGKLKQK